MNFIKVLHNVVSLQHLNKLKKWLLVYLISQTIISIYIYFCSLGPKCPSASDIEKEDIAKETHIEKDDSDMLKYLRSKDDYKDEHRRGEGNRFNRS